MPSTELHNRQVTADVFHQIFDGLPVAPPPTIEAAMQGEQIRKLPPEGIIIVAGASMDKNPRTGKMEFRTIVDSDRDNHGNPQFVAGDLRLTACQIAATELEFDGTFAITGGYQHGVSKAEEFANQLVADYNVPEEQIVVIGKKGHGNTNGNITDIEDFLEVNRIEDPNLILLTSRWHAPRLVYRAEKKLPKPVDLLVAEDLNYEYRPELRGKVDQQQALPALRRRLRDERSGIEAYAKGTYKPRNS